MAKKILGYIKLQVKWRETWITSVMVFIMVAITGVFFLAVDQALGNAMQFLFKLAAS